MSAVTFDLAMPLCPCFPGAPAVLTYRGQERMQEV